MRIFIDACIDPRVVEGFTAHEVKTAVQMGWHRLKDHELVRKLEGQLRSQQVPVGQPKRE
jgi:hypothetical protein